jgi:hypothetical protein
MRRFLCELVIERELSVDEPLDALRTAVVFTEDDAELPLDLLDKHVVGLRERVVLSGLREGTIPRGGPEDLSVAPDDARDEMIHFALVGEPLRGGCRELERPTLRVREHEPNERRKRDVCSEQTVETVDDRADRVARGNRASLPNALGECGGPACDPTGVFIRANAMAEDRAVSSLKGESPQLIKPEETEEHEVGERAGVALGHAWERSRTLEKAVDRREGGVTLGVTQALTPPLTEGGGVREGHARSGMRVGR